MAHIFEDMGSAYPSPPLPSRTLEKTLPATGNATDQIKFGAKKSDIVMSSDRRESRHLYTYEYLRFLHSLRSVEMTM